MVDVSVAIAGATGGLSSALVVSAAGFPVLALSRLPRRPGACVRRPVSGRAAG